MKVQLDTLADFLDEIRHDCERVLNKCVRARIVMDPHQDEAVSFDVYIQATAVVKCDNGTDSYLLETAAIPTGEYYESKRDDGIKEAKRLITEIQETCDDCGLTYRTGKIEVW